MAFNYFDASTSRRLSIGLMAMSGALLFAALDMIGVARSIDDMALAAEVSKSLSHLALSAGGGFVALIWTEIADHPDTPPTGHPHSKSNYLQSAFALLLVSGVFLLGIGTFELVGAASVP